MMTPLKKYKLNLELAHEYFIDNLSQTNTLSSALINSVDFKSGHFFTLLPELVDLTKIHEFKYGRRAKGVRDQVVHIVLENLLSNYATSCIFDDFNSTYEDGYDFPLFLSCGLKIEKEIYYVVTQKKASLSLIKECFFASDAIWHSLCVLIKRDFNDYVSKTLTTNQVNNICLNTQLIILGAYDQEGYIFWQR